MGTVRQRKAAKNTNKNTRRVADRHRKRITIHVSALTAPRSRKKVYFGSNLGSSYRVTLLLKPTGTKS